MRWSKRGPQGADRTVRLGGPSFHYRDWGPVEMPAILILHGLGHNAAHWDPVAAALAEGRRSWCWISAAMVRVNGRRGIPSP
jgi:pimeloyl-ACP methyl ester carboxylesterase